MKINEINIHITKAVITSVTIELDDEQKVPKFTVQGKLFTQQGMAVSDFNFTSEKHSWLGTERVIEVPFSLLSHSMEIFKDLTPVIYKKINGLFKELPAPKEEKKEDLAF